MEETKYATYSDKEIGDAIEQGAITKEYLADPQRIISSLNRLRSTEITSYLQYKQHAYMAVSLLSPGLKGEFESHAEQELTHADRLAQRIQQLGPARVTSPSHIQDGFCVRRRPPDYLVFRCSTNRTHRLLVPQARWTRS
jgi:DNA-binding ferritin-like protein